MAAQVANSSTVQMADIDDPVVYGVTSSGTDFSLVATSSGDGKSKEAAYKVYLPFKSSGGSQDNYHYLVSSGIPSKSGGGAIKFQLDLDVDSGDYFHIAIRNGDDDSYFVASSYNIGTADPVNVSLTTSSICAITSEFDCDSLDASSSVVDDAYFFFFFDSTQRSNGYEMKPSDYTGGLFVRVYASTDIDDYDDGATSATQITSVTGDRGDASAYIDFAGTISSTTYMNGLISYNGTTRLDTYDLGSDESGEILVSGLTNGVAANIILRYRDKFGYQTNIGNDVGVTITPTTIETLLEEKSCYLVTAGFQRDHYVLDYFRHIRDNYLIKSYLGEKFVNVYYSTAPKYASLIYKNKVLSFLVRGLSYLVYGLFKYFFWISGLALLITLALRIKIQWQKEFS